MDDAAMVELKALTDESTSRIVNTKPWKIKINEAGTGHPVIMMHGTGPGATGWSNFNQNFRYLASKYRVILVDAPGWGGSDPLGPSDGGWLGPAHAESLKSLLDELNIEQAALVGNSMGGMTTMRFCQAYPERVSHAITMGAGIMGTNILAPGGPPEGIRVIVETYNNPTPENFRRLVSVMVYDPSFVTDELCEQRSRGALANKTHLENWLASAHGLAQARGAEFGALMDKLSTFKAPCLFVHGRDDRVVPLESTLRAVATVPNARAVIFNHCGHWAQVEHAHEFNVLVDAFLSGSATGGVASAANRAFGS
jgi:2-hydroxy-6-oxonona-2,4-dienedioate hydrolase